MASEAPDAFAIAFGLICLAFLVAVICHIVLISADSAWALSLSDAAKQAFHNVQLRTATIKGVALPFGPGFISILNERWSSTAFALIEAGFKLTELEVILMIALVIVMRLKSMLAVEKMIIAYGVLGYLSWYIFAYQHIMWHQMYEWYIFSLTIGLAFSLLLIIYLNQLIAFILTFYHKKVV